jgi:hypothetical protein
MQRMCQLAKPWLKLRPRIQVALEDIDTLTNIQCNSFASWWKKYHDEWTAHWNIQKWDIDNIFGVCVFGKITQTDLLKMNLKNNLFPRRIAL